MPSFEFVLNGPPVSQRSRQRLGLHEWKDLVRDEAERLWNPGFAPSNASLQFSITYYYEDIPVDTDDIVKPIMDALIGLVYNDNSQITEVTQSRQDLYGSFRIPHLSPTLAAGFGRGSEFLHVQIDGLESYEEPAAQASDRDVTVDNAEGQDQQELGSNPVDRQALEELREPEPPVSEAGIPDEADSTTAGSQKGGE